MRKYSICRTGMFDMKIACHWCRGENPCIQTQRENEMASRRASDWTPETLQPFEFLQNQVFRTEFLIFSLVPRTELLFVSFSIGIHYDELYSEGAVQLMWVEIVTAFPSELWNCIDFEMTDTSFFKTEVAFDEQQRISSKPAIVSNMVALRETFLSEAPFVNQSNKLFWKKWIDSPEYINMLSSSFSFVQNCISDTGCVFLDKLNDIQNSDLALEMASNLADMFFLQRPRDRDLFFNRLPELLCFMIANNLTTWNPKHQRLHNSCRFRELLLDFLNELITGIRPTDCRKNREWIFADANEAQIMTSNSNPRPSATSEAVHRRAGGNIARLASVQSTCVIGHSPLINAYLGVNGDPSNRLDRNCLKLTLCHLPTRPLSCLTEDNVSSMKNVREKKITGDIIKETIRLGRSRRLELHRSSLDARVTLQHDRQLLRQHLRTNLAVLDKKPVSNKRLVAAMAAHQALSAGSSTAVAPLPLHADPATSSSGAGPWAGRHLPPSNRLSILLVYILYFWYLFC